jgi:hypothetical protein
VKSWIWIRNIVKIQELLKLKMEAWMLKMEAWRVRIPVVAVSHHLNEEQDPGPDPH